MPQAARRIAISATITIGIGACGLHAVGGDATNGNGDGGVGGSTSSGGVTADGSLIPTDGDNGSSESGSPVGSDSGAPDSDAQSPLPTGCISFANGTPTPYVFEGTNATVTAVQGVGVKVKLVKDSTGDFWGTFQAPGQYTKSHVDVHVIYTVMGSPTDWGGAGGDYANLLKMFYGSTRNFQTASEVEIALAQNGVDINVFTANGASGQDYYRFSPTLKVPTGDTHVIADIVWGNTGAGNINVAIGGGSKGMSVKTAISPLTDSLTVQIGGASHGNVPDLEWTVRDVCITFPP